jgi:hypothetical protein
MTALRIFALLLLMAVVPTSLSAGSPPSTGINMGTAYCLQAAYDCGKISSERKNIVEAANKCVQERLFISGITMTDFNSSGENENCVTADNTSTSATGGEVWATCCIKKGQDEQCNLFCTRYMAPGK